MADKQVTLEDLARAEAATAELQAARKRAYREGQKQLLVETPQRFLRMARQLQQGVERFNGAARLARPLLYLDSAAVGAPELRPGADLVVEVRREPSWMVLALRSMWRLMADDALVIEADGSLGIAPQLDRVALRIQGVFRGEQLAWRVTSAGQPVDTPIDELPERMVAAVATGELSRLWVKAPFLGPTG